MSSGSSNVRGGAQVLAAGIIWGSIGVFVAELSEAGLNAGMISFLRVSFACLFSLIVVLVKEGVSGLKISRSDLISCALLGIVCHGIYNIFYSYAVTYAGVTVSAVLLNIAPAITMFTAAFLFREPVTVSKIIAVIINMIGCTLTVTGGNFSSISFSLIGIGCGIGAGVCYAMTAIFGKLASGGKSPWVVSTYSYLFAAFSLLFYAKPANYISSISANAWITAILYALIPTTAAYFFYYSGVQKIKNTGIVPILASAETVVAAIFGVFLYREHLNAVSLMGILFVLISVGFSQVNVKALHSVRKFFLREKAEI